MREVVGAGEGRVVWWVGVVPERCERCGAKITAVFVDCKTTMGGWGSLCVWCAGELAVSSSPALCRVFQRCDEGWVSLF
jgi:hypothetical protein